MNSSKLATNLALCLVLVGCSTSTDRNLDLKMQNTANPKNRIDLQSESSNLLASNKTLSKEQIQRLTKIRNNLTARTDQLNLTSFQLRSILMNDLLSSDNRKEEVDSIKERLRKISSDRLTAMFDAVDQANEVLGKEASANTHIIHEFMNDYEVRSNL
jgi:hypothetical protein